MLCSHRFPLYPALQLQLYPSSVLVHVAPFMHGLEVQGLTLSAQVGP